MNNLWILPKNMEFMVKSLRSESKYQSVVNSTSAWRPSQTRSMRKVVISKFSLSFKRQVMVPCSSPFLCNIRIPSRPKISCICSGVAVVAKSTSAGFTPISRSRTAPPAIRNSNPFFLSEKIPFMEIISTKI